MSESPSERLDALINLLIDNRIAKEEHDELQKLISGSPVALNRYLQWIELHSNLRSVLCSDAVDFEFDRKIGSESSRSYRDDAWINKVFVLAIAASILVLACYAILFFVRGNGALKQDLSAIASLQESVRLKQLAHAEFFGERNPSLRAPLSWQRDYTLKTGVIELEFPSGASAIIEGPATFSIANAERLVLSTGSCSVYAPEGAQGFQVETPLSEITDRGTRFSVSVDEAGITDVQVIEGEAEVEPIHRKTAIDHDASRLLKTAEAIRVRDAEGLLSENAVFDASRFRRQLPDRVISYNAEADDHGNVARLIDLTVQRAGILTTYARSQLNMASVTSFCEAESESHRPLAVAADLAQFNLDDILGDDLLNTGVINPGGAGNRNRQSADRTPPHSQTFDPKVGMQFRFREPLINSPGPDVVVFELQTATNSPQGDRFLLFPLSEDRGKRWCSIDRFDITLNSKEARKLQPFSLLYFDARTESLADLKSKEHRRSLVRTTFYALAVAIDLSSMGIVDGGSVEGLVIEDALDDDSFVDPTFVAGLPPSIQQ